MARFGIARLEGGSKELLEEVSGKMDSIQVLIDQELALYQEKLKELESIKQRIAPLRERMSPLGEFKAAIASRYSRAKYFPEFATRNFDSSKDEEFLEFVRKNI